MLLLVNHNGAFISQFSQEDPASEVQAQDGSAATSVDTPAR